MINPHKLGYLYWALVGTILVSQCPQPSSSQARSIDPETQKRIDDFIQDSFLPASQISLLGLTVVQNDGEILYTTGYGMADQERGVPAGNSTQFLVGSITKSFTSVLGAKLLHEKFPDLGEAVLDTPIRKLLPEINFTLIDRFRSEYTTFRDLVSHRTCLFPLNMNVFSEAMTSIEEIIYGSRYENEVCGFRSEFVYNNQMYVLAGGIIAALANKSFNDVAQDLLNDIGMLNSAPSKITDDYTQLPFRAMPYYVMDNEAHPMNTDLIKRSHLAVPAGGLFINSNDMAKYMRLYLNLGNIDGRQIVPREVMEWLRKPSIALPAPSFKESNEDLIVNQFSYGLGLHASTYDGWQYVQHAGYFAPYSSQMSLYPAKNLGIFSSTSMGPVMVNQMVLHAYIFEILQGSDDATAIEKAMRVKAQVETEKADKIETASRRLRSIYEKSHRHGTLDIVGRYGSGSAGEAEISEKFNEDTNRTEYYLAYGRWITGWLQPLPDTEDMFKLNLDTDAIHDNYAGGDKEGLNFAAFGNDTLSLLIINGYTGVVDVTATFKLGLRSDLLPPVPWNPDSCGPDQDK